MGAPAASRKSLQIPGGAKVVGALLTGSAALAASYTSATASALRDSSERCVLLALEVREEAATAQAAGEDDDYQVYSLCLSLSLSVSLSLSLPPLSVSA